MDFDKNCDCCYCKSMKKERIRILNIRISDLKYQIKSDSFQDKKSDYKYALKINEMELSELES